MTEIRTASASGGRSGKLVSVTNHQLAPIAPTWARLRSAGPEAITRTLLAVALTPADHQSLVVPVASDEDADVLVRHAVPPRLLSWMRSRAGPRAPSPAARHGSSRSSEAASGIWTPSAIPHVSRPVIESADLTRGRPLVGGRGGGRQAAVVAPISATATATTTIASGLRTVWPERSRARTRATRAVAPVSARKGIVSQFTPEPSSGPHDSTSEAAKSDTASTDARGHPPRARRDAATVESVGLEADRHDGEPREHAEVPDPLAGGEREQHKPDRDRGGRKSLQEIPLPSPCDERDGRRYDEERDELAARRRRSPLPEGS